MKHYLGGVLRLLELPLISTQDKEMAILQEQQCIIEGGNFLGFLNFLCSWAIFFKAVVIILYYLNFE